MLWKLHLLTFLMGAILPNPIVLGCNQAQVSEDCDTIEVYCNVLFI